MFQSSKNSGNMLFFSHCRIVGYMGVQTTTGTVLSTMALYGGVGNFGVKILYCFFLPSKALLLA